MYIYIIHTTRNGVVATQFPERCCIAIVRDSAYGIYTLLVNGIITKDGAVGPAQLEIDLRRRSLGVFLSKGAR